MQVVAVVGLASGERVAERGEGAATRESRFKVVVLVLASERSERARERATEPVDMASLVGALESLVWLLSASQERTARVENGEVSGSSERLGDRRLGRLALDAERRSLFIISQLLLGRVVTTPIDRFALGANAAASPRDAPPTRSPISEANPRSMVRPLPRLLHEGSLDRYISDDKAATATA